MLEAVEQEGLSHGIFTLGQCYFHGISMEEDNDKAVELFEEAASQGNDNAMVRLGLC